jgi:DNA-binding transcriptional LysR family regulator
MSRFSLVDLQLFVNVADSGSMTAGADRSHLSVSAASVRIKQLEEDAGARLLIRGTRDAGVTPAGEIMLKRARGILGEFQRMKDELRDFTERFSGTIRVLANATSINPALTGVLGQFLSEHPGVAIDLKECISSDGLKAVSTGSADLAIVAEDPSDSGLQAVPYRSEDLVVCTSTANPSVSSDSTSFSFASTQPQIMLHKSSALRQFLDKKAHERGVALQCRVEVDNYTSMLDLVRANIGVGILPRYALNQYHAGAAVVTVQLDEGWAKRNSFVCSQPIKSVTASTRKLISMLANVSGC